MTTNPVPAPVLVTGGTGRSVARLARDPTDPTAYATRTAAAGIWTAPATRQAGT